ncbi:MAG: CPBP family intramembrane metalloprotease [Gemmatimonadetes bacterium]|nr:CPBP family intramembrane metalloprotease [Gemmatimonadota bacterium]
MILLIGLPILAALDARREIDLEAAAEHRRMLYLSVASSLIVIGLVTLGVAAWQSVPATDLGWGVVDGTTALLWGLATTVVGLGLIWAVTAGARAIGLRESPVARLLMPRDGPETRGFLLLSGVAAVCEEYAFRGFGLWAAGQVVGSPWIGAALVSLSFGLAHGYQRLAGILRAGALGMLLAAPTIWTGSLFPAIVAHFWINAAVGLGGWRILLPELVEEDRDPAG